jgi:hypothetical protein
MQNCTLIAGADSQCFDNDMKTWQLQNSPLLVALFEQLLLPDFRLLIKEG